MKQVATELIILKRINFGEADRILTVLTKDLGQMSMLAKGVRKTKSKLAGGLELFSVSEVNYIDGKSKIKTVISTRLKSYFKHIVSDVERTMAGYDYMKIVGELSEHADGSDFFSLLESGLESLNNTTLPVALVDVWFFSKILHVTGSSINLEKPLEKSKFSEEDMYNFSYEDMSFYVYDSGVFGPNHIKFLRLVDRSVKPQQLTSVAGYNNLAVDLQKIVKQSCMMHKA
jgi:DNA repair protein RecO